MMEYKAVFGFLVPKKSLQDQSEVKKLPELIRYIRGKRLLTDKGFTFSGNRKILAEAGLKSGLSYKASKEGGITLKL